MFFLAATGCAQTFRAEDNGASPTLASNSLAIQATLDQASAGGTVTITTPGTYLLTPQDNNPYFAGHLYCLVMAHDNVVLFVGAGVVLKLADNQQSEKPVDIIVFQARTNLTFAGRGEINGNSFNQPNWAGGYSQIDHGIIISGYGVVAGAANTNITVKDLTLKNHFSNPINIDCNGSTRRNSNIRIERVHASDCGEGIQVISADDVWITDCTVDSPKHVAVGDGIEVSNTTRFQIRGCAVQNHRSASGFDIFASRDGVVDNWTSDDNDNGVAVHSFGGLPDPANVTVSNGVVTNMRNAAEGGVCDGVELNALTLTDVKVVNVRITGTPFGFGFQLGVPSGNKSVGPVVIENCIVTGAQDGILVAAAFSKLKIVGGNYLDNRNRGIVLLYSAGLLPADVGDLYIEGVTATGNGGAGILIDNQGFLVPPITGVINNLTLTENAAPILAGPEGAGLVVSNITPDSKTEFGGGSGASVFGVKFFCPTGANATSFQNPSWNQVLVITACEERDIIDARQGGTNIYLTGGRSVHLRVGDSLVLSFDSLTNKWREDSRMMTPPPPNLSTEVNSDKAIALNASNFLREPFPPLTEPNFSADNRTRIMLFVDNLGLLSSEDMGLITVQAEDSLFRTYELPVEHVGWVSDPGSLIQINVRLPEELFDVGEVWVSVSLRGVTGNKASLNLRLND